MLENGQVVVDHPQQLNRGACELLDFFLPLRLVLNLGEVVVEILHLESGIASRLVGGGETLACVSRKVFHLARCLESSALALAIDLTRLP